MVHLISLMLFAGLVQVNCEVPLEWEVWSQGVQRHLLTADWAPGPGKPPAPGTGKPPGWTWQPYDSWINSWQNAGMLC